MITSDQYYAINALQRWYRKGRKQLFEISGTVGTGMMETVNEFLNLEQFSPWEICYLTYDQRKIVQYAESRLHCYYLPNIIYKWTRQTDLDSIDYWNPMKKTEVTWHRHNKKRLPEDYYRIIVVLDSLLIDRESLEALCGFNKPILLLRDPGLIPSSSSYCYGKEPTVKLEELNSKFLKDPISYFAMKALTGDRINTGSFGSVSVVTKRQLNLYNLKSSDMVITSSEELSDDVNNLYRHKVKHYNDTTKVGERMICMSDMYDFTLKNSEEPRIKCFLRSGTVGYLTKCWSHAPGTKYVPISFKFPWWNEPFTELVMDRTLIIPDNIRMNNRQVEPDNTAVFRYAYALPVMLARIGNWDRVTVICDSDPYKLGKRERQEIYTAICKCNKKLTLCI